MDVTTEIASFTATDAYKANRDLLHPFIDKLKDVEGLIRAYLGWQIEDPNNAYIFIDWHSIESHENLKKSQLFDAIQQAMKPATGGMPNMVHVEFTKSPEKVFTAPTTEIAIISPKPGYAKESVIKILEELDKVDVAKTGKIHALLWGPLIEKQDSFVLLVGWDSVESHMICIREDPVIAPLVQKLGELADIDLKHANVRLVYK